MERPLAKDRHLNGLTVLNIDTQADMMIVHKKSVSSKRNLKKFRILINFEEIGHMFLSIDEPYSIEPIKNL